MVSLLGHYSGPPGPVTGRLVDALTWLRRWRVRLQLAVTWASSSRSALRSDLCLAGSLPDFRTCFWTSAGSRSSDRGVLHGFPSLREIGGPSGPRGCWAVLLGCGDQGGDVRGWTWMSALGVVNLTTARCIVRSACARTDVSSVSPPLGSISPRLAAVLRTRTCGSLCVLVGGGTPGPAVTGPGACHSATRADSRPRQVMERRTA